MRRNQLVMLIACAVFTASSANAFAGIHTIPGASPSRIDGERGAMPDPSEQELILQAALLAAKGNLEKQLPILQTLAEIYREQSRLHEEESCLLRVIGILHSRDGISSVYAAIAYLRLSSIYFEMEEFQKAEMAGQSAIDVFRKSCGSASVNLALAYNNLGWIELKMKKFDKAESHLLQALEILRRTIGSNHMLYGLISQNLGELFWQRGNAEHASKWYRQALKILNKNLPPGDAAIVGLTRRYAESQQLLEKKAGSRRR